MQALTQFSRRKRFWRYVLIAVISIGIAAIIINTVILLKIYGCAGATFSQMSVSGICSDSGLKTVTLLTRILEVIIIICFIAGIIAPIMAAIVDWKEHSRQSGK